MPIVNVFEKINGEYYQLTSAEKKVADYAVIHQQQTQFMYKGYSAFKLAIANATAGRQEPGGARREGVAEDSLEGICRAAYENDVDALRQTLELLRPEAIHKAADMIASAGRVLCMGQGGSMILAQECAHLFSTIQMNFQAVMDSHMQAIAASQLTAGDVVIYFSYSGSTTALLKNLQLIQERKARSILVTRFPKSPGAAYADVVLQCGAREGPLQGGSVAARVAQLYLMDVLFREICRRDPEGCRSRQEMVAEVLSDKHI